MGTSNAGSIAQLPIAGDALAFEPVSEQARDFHFAVTWFGLFAHVGPIESGARRPRLEEPSSSLALVPVVASAPFVEQRALEQRVAQQFTPPDSNAAWEMVVPKMIRTGSRTFVPADDGRQSGQGPRL
jgi:hypothetical protein